MDDLREKLQEALESEDLWLNFDTGTFVSDDDIREMIRVGSLKQDVVSTRPDIFPVFGDLAGAAKLMKREVMTFSDGDDSTKYECFPNVTGFSNPSDYCFMDSVLMAMFFLKNSPFYDGIFNSTFDAKNMRCSKDPKANARVKQEVRDIIQSDVDRIMNGEKNYTCKRLRQLIGKTCMGNDEDMSFSTHDSYEFYNRLLDIVNYNPITTREITYKTTTPQNKSTQNPIPNTGFVIDAPMTEDQEGKDVSWSGIAKYTDDAEGIMYIHETKLVSGDVLVIHVKRLFGSMGPVKVINGKKVSDITEKFTKQAVKVDRSIDAEFVDGSVKTYNLMSVVYPLGGPGHYQALLKCDGKWYMYNDVAATKPYQKNIVADAEVERIITTWATILFYY